MDTVLLLAAAFVAGALNAVAGGGSFLTLPALVFTGVPPVVANATGTVALLPGYMAGAWGFREDMQPPPGLSMRSAVPRRSCRSVRSSHRISSNIPASGSATTVSTRIRA